jgi:hypothetical protein
MRLDRGDRLLTRAAAAAVALKGLLRQAQEQLQTAKEAAAAAALMGAFKLAQEQLSNRHYKRSKMRGQMQGPACAPRGPCVCSGVCVCGGGGG